MTARMAWAATFSGLLIFVLDVASGKAMPYPAAALIGGVSTVLVGTAASFLDPRRARR